MTHYLDLPGPNNSFYDHRLRYELRPSAIFVFGSNLQGIHGAGAAREAALNYGAVYGIGEGVQGQSYAIPTREKVNGRIVTLPLSRILWYVEQFKEIALEVDDEHFFITPLGTGLAGYDHSQIAPMFRGIRNSWLPDCWEPYLRNT